jgi:hypothetical protein
MLKHRHERGLYDKSKPHVIVANRAQHTLGPALFVPFNLHNQITSSLHQSYSTCLPHNYCHLVSSIILTL